MIDHNHAIRIEHIVESALKCDRGAMAGLVDADYFEKNPRDAAVMIIAARVGDLDEKRVVGFACDWLTRCQSVTQETVEDFCVDLKTLLD